MIVVVSLISFAILYCLLIEQKEFASILICILNLECVVRLPGNNVVAISYEAVAKTI